MTTGDVPGAANDAVAGPDGYDPTVPPPSPGVYDLGDVTRHDVFFPSDGFRMAGHLYLPRSGWYVPGTRCSPSTGGTGARAKDRSGIST
jgi:hypothetical protein